MAKDINEAVREVCLSFPDTEEYLSHGSPNFRVRKGKTFATYAVNHHGDGRIALWLNAPEGAQAHYAGNEPKHFFVPPYVGPRGWLGVNLDSGVSWKRVAALVREAYEKVAPGELCARIGRTVEIVPPRATLSAEQFNPMQAPRARRVVAGGRRIWASWPDVTEEGQFGFPVWRVGRKTFAQAYRHSGRLYFGFWVGVDRQGLLLSDRRYQLRPYMGHMGWIGLDVTHDCDWQEVRNLAIDSYRHFALKRTLLAFEASPTAVSSDIWSRSKSSGKTRRTGKPSGKSRTGKSRSGNARAGASRHR